jgi:hypothetical protein
MAGPAPSLISADKLGNLAALIEVPIGQNFNTPLTLAGGQPAIISALPGWRPGGGVRQRFRDISLLSEELLSNDANYCIDSAGRVCHGSDRLRWFAF